MHSKYVVAPEDSETLASHLRDYKIAGLNVCFGSMDATHVAMERCYDGLNNIHSGGKLKGSCRTCNIVTNNCRKF